MDLALVVLIAFMAILCTPEDEYEDEVTDIVLECKTNPERYHEVFLGGFKCG